MANYDSGIITTPVLNHKHLEQKLSMKVNKLCNRKLNKKGKKYTCNCCSKCIVVNFIFFIIVIVFLAGKNGYIAVLYYSKRQNRSKYCNELYESEIIQCEGG